MSKSIAALLVIMALVVALFVPMAQASSQEQSLSGKYVCYGPSVITPDGEEAQPYYIVSKREADVGLANGEYVQCFKILPNQ